MQNRDCCLCSVAYDMLHRATCAEQQDVHMLPTERCLSDAKISVHVSVQPDCIVPIESMDTSMFFAARRRPPERMVPLQLRCKSAHVSLMAHETKSSQSFSGSHLQFHSLHNGCDANADEVKILGANQSA